MIANETKGKIKKKSCWKKFDNSYPVHVRMTEKAYNKLKKLRKNDKKRRGISKIISEIVISSKCLYDKPKKPIK